MSINEVKIKYSNGKEQGKIEFMRQWQKGNFV